MRKGDEVEKDLEVAKNKIVSETESQLSVQEQLKREMRKFEAENAKLKDNYKQVENENLL